VLALQLLTNHVGVSAMAEETLPQPFLQAIERRLALGLAESRRAAGAKITPDRVARAELLRQTFGPPAKFMEPRHRGHLLRLKHRLSPHPDTLVREILDPRSPYVPLLCAEGGQLSESTGGSFQCA
jgi:hypothetical protein